MRTYQEYLDSAECIEDQRKLTGRRVECRCGAVLDESEVRAHHCPTFDFVGRTQKETVNSNAPRLG